jgi:hypothetical protein
MIPVNDAAALQWPWSDEGAICSCGDVTCRDLGWPHEWNPIDTGDSCTLLCDEPFTHETPYARYGSGYAHVACIQGSS